ncbi:MAG TPA: hypothetical protein VFN67_14770, partial [Polyangiales bacterium]|nr:hypothetical protein [Polyangiales bacterium]
MKQPSSFVALLCLCLLPALVSGFVAPTRAVAQTEGFSINRFDVSERGSDWFVGDSLDLRSHGPVRPSVGFVLDYANKPLVLYSDEGVERAVIVKDQFYGHFGASLVIAERVRLALNVPVAFMTNGQSAAWLDRTIAANSGTTLGDLRIGADLRLVGRYGGPATLALGAQVYVPTGQQTYFTGDGAVRLTPHLSLAG